MPQKIDEEDGEWERKPANNQQPAIAPRPQAAAYHSEEVKALLERFREEEPSHQGHNYHELEDEENEQDTFIPTTPEPVVYTDAAKALLAKFRETEDEREMVEDEFSAETAIAIALEVCEEEEDSPLAATAESILDMQSYLGSSIWG